MTDLTLLSNGDVTNLFADNILVRAHLSFDASTALLTYYRSRMKRVVALTDSPASVDCGPILAHKYQIASLADAGAKFDLWETFFELKTPNCPSS